MIETRQEEPEDIPAIWVVNERAFGLAQEADIVDRVRENCHDLMSLVAVTQGDVVGHILFSPATIDGQDHTIRGMSLGPMAVLSEYQRQGVGVELVKAGLSRLESNDCPFVVVLGHAGYYPRFGFEPASRLGIRSEWDVPDDAFMIPVLNEPEIGACRDWPSIVLNPLKRSKSPVDAAVTHFRTSDHF